MDPIVEAVMEVRIDVIVAECGDSVAVFQDVLVLPAVPVCVPWLHRISRGECGDLVLRRHEDSGIRSCGVVSLEIRSQECRDRTFAIIGNIHQEGQVILLLFVEAYLHLFPGGQSTKGLGAFLEDSEMKVRSLPRFPSKHLGTKHFH